jgi:hypothetical protein
MEAINDTSTDTNSKFDWQNTRMEQLVPGNSYTNPVVLGQVMSANAGWWSSFWSCNGSALNAPDSSAIYVGKHVGEDSATTRANDTLGVIILEAGNGSIDGINYTANLGSDTIEGIGNSPAYSYTLSGITAANSAIVSQSAMDGADGGWMVLFGSNPISGSSLKIAVDEDQIGDAERAHTHEQAAYIVFE